jgi:hypothetical protein
MSETKLSKLTPLARDAVMQTQAQHGLTILRDGATFVVFAQPPADVIAGIDRAIARNPSRGHPRASLWSVRRRAAAELGARQAELEAKYPR